MSKRVPLTARQQRKANKMRFSHQRDMARIQQSTAKTAIKEAGSTIRSGVAALAANKGLESYQAAKNRDTNSKSYENAIKVYNDIINSVGTDSQGGKTQDKSTGEVGGSGSIMGG